jgi:hypothetical protein
MEAWSATWDLGTSSAIVLGLKEIEGFFLMKV